MKMFPERLRLNLNGGDLDCIFLCLLTTEAMSQPPHTLSPCLPTVTDCTSSVSRSKPPEAAFASVLCSIPREQALETLRWGLGCGLLRLGLVARSRGLETARCSQATVDLTGNLGMMPVDSSHSLESSVEFLMQKSGCGLTIPPP